MTIHEKARHLFKYDAKRGVLRWRRDRVVALTNHLTIKAFAGDIAGWLSDSGYRTVMFCGKKRRASRVIWLLVHGRYPRQELDHINGRRHDDRLCNLREATPHQNRCNSKIRVDNTSGHKGVCWSKFHNRWRANIRVDGKQTYLGVFINKADAAKAYIYAAHRHFGAFARIR